MGTESVYRMWVQGVDTGWTQGVCMGGRGGEYASYLGV